MATKLIKYMDKAACPICEFVVDSTDDIASLPTTTEQSDDYDFIAPIGSTCIVGNEGGDTLVYMLFSFGWKEI